MFRLIFSVAVAVTACAPAASSTAPIAPSSASAEREIERVIDDFHRAAAASDEARYFDHFAEEGVFLGTDASERWRKEAFRAYAHPHFEKGKGWRFRAVRRAVVVAADGNLAWFDEDLATVNLGPARGSGVLARRDGRWKILHYNLALTIPNERFALVAEAAGGAQVRAVSDTDPLRDLAWLSGAWAAQKEDGSLVEEVWTSADGGSMIGSGRTIEKGATTFFEHLRIEVREGTVVYIAQPRGEAPTEFVRQPSPPGEASFENRAHDWPKRIVYQRTAEGISVRASGSEGQRSEHWTLQPAVIARGTGK